MQVIKGHLTPTNKKHIKAILNANLSEAKVNRINYHLTLDNGFYTVKIVLKDRGLGFIGNELRLSTYISVFKL